MQLRKPSTQLHHTTGFDLLGSFYLTDPFFFYKDGGKRDTLKITMVIVISCISELCVTL